MGQYVFLEVIWRNSIGVDFIWLIFNIQLILLYLFNYKFLGFNCHIFSINFNSTQPMVSCLCFVTMKNCINLVCTCMHSIDTLRLCCADVLARYIVVGNAGSVSSTK